MSKLLGPTGLALLSLSFFAPAHAADVRMQPREGSTEPAPALPRARATGPAVSPGGALPRKIQPNPRALRRSAVLPDLAIAGLKVSPRTVSSGATATLSAVVSNSGATALSDVKVRFLLGRTRLGEAVIALGPKSTARAEITAPLRGSGTVTVTAVVDPERLVAEGEERNNIVQAQVTIVPPPTATLQMRDSAARAARNKSGAGSAARRTRNALTPAKDTPPPAAAALRRAPTIAASQSAPGKGGVPITTALPPLQPPPGSPANRDSAPAAYDLRCSVETTNGVYLGDGTTVRLRIDNTGTSTSPPFTAGFGVSGQVAVNSPGAWLGTIAVPKVFAGQHLYVALPWKTQVLGNPELVAAVDIAGAVAELDESNNYSKPFRYQAATATVLAPPPLGVGTPSEAFSVTVPGEHDRFATPGDIQVMWYSKQHVLDLPKNEQAPFLALEIFLVDSTTGAMVAKLAEDADNDPLDGLKDWSVSLPAAIQPGSYKILLRTPSGGGWGKSGTFTLYRPKVAKMALPGTSVAPASGAVPDAAMVNKINIAYGKKTPVTVSVRIVDVSIQTEPVAAGQPEIVKSTEVKYEITADQDFRMVARESEIDDPELEHVTLYPIFMFGPNWLAPGETPNHVLPEYGINSPGIVFTPQKVYRKGANVISVRYELNGLHYSYPLDYPLCAVEKCHASNRGKTDCIKLDFWISTSLSLRGKDYLAGGFIGRTPIVHTWEPRKRIWR